ncbi:MAG: ISAzo13 family transposase [Nitrososphaera sp.]
MVAQETAGDPMSDQKWIRSSLRRLGERLEKIGHQISPPTVGRLLKKLDFSLKVNFKKNESGQDHPARDAQFNFIAEHKSAFEAAGLPIISVDTKKKELIGDFKNAGQTWCQNPEIVNVHDFPHDAIGRSVPYGIYDLTNNRGYVYVGASADTPEFAVNVIARWWQQEGHATYPNAEEILILADAGGSNGCRPRVWKQQIQEQLCDRLGLHVTVCHYPTGCSKYNPIEHRLFSQISINWAGKPLRTFETMLGYIRHTVTTTGLRVKAFLFDGLYEIGKRVSDAEMKTLNLEHHPVCSNWNYTIRPRLDDAQVT